MGEALWRERDAPRGSLVFAGGMPFLRSEEGPMLLIEPNRDRYIGRGRFDPPHRSESRTWAHPVVANDRMYVRDQGDLLCDDVKAT